MYIYYFSSSHPKADLKGKVVFDIVDFNVFNDVNGLLKRYATIVPNTPYVTVEKADFRYSP